MIYPSLDELLNKVDSRYTLVTAAAKRARQIIETEKTDEDNTLQAVSIALEEINAGKINVERTKTGIK
ncbi:MAG: DNA-directed RNA polymerase subunit omega [Firmicutes bacterium]|nr:DNA-directed RNA polymerase subunit omega [Bacillota bacterium]